MTWKLQRRRHNFDHDNSPPLMWLFIMLTESVRGGGVMVDRPLHLEISAPLTLLLYIDVPYADDYVSKKKKGIQKKKIP